MLQLDCCDGTTPPARRYLLLLSILRMPMVLLCASFLFSVLCAERLSLPVTSNLSQPVQVRRQQQRSAVSHWYSCLPSRQVDVAVPTPEQQKLGLQGGGFRQFPVRYPYSLLALVRHYTSLFAPGTSAAPTITFMPFTLQGPEKAK